MTIAWQASSSIACYELLDGNKAASLGKAARKDATWQEFSTRESNRRRQAEQVSAEQVSAEQVNLIKGWLWLCHVLAVTFKQKGLHGGCLALASPVSQQNSYCDGQPIYIELAEGSSGASSFP